MVVNRPPPSIVPNCCNMEAANNAAQVDSTRICIILAVIKIELYCIIVSGKTSNSLYILTAVGTFDGAEIQLWLGIILIGDFGRGIIG